MEENMTQWSYNSLSNLKYLDQVISESQRLHPVNTSLSRQCTVEKFKLPGTEIWIPRGTHICIPTFAMYKDPKYFPEPDRFNPDRFSKEKSDQISKIFLPFGEGPRQCIAKRFALIEVKSVISNLILNFNFVPCLVV
ncbi:cytochrome P450 3A9-like [Diaphorina citri]|uniref:Cytochrome P450 3A9-like n=1 Tax=Diaphorina citri TaxID=121845 RepID=A0A1S4EQD2_DIACI|nr:cytochrome P450 3A9-like [Diaphorina citri]